MHTTNRVLVVLGATVLVVSGAAIAIRRAGGATPGIEAGAWRLVAVVNQGRPQPVDPAFAAEPAVVTFGRGHIHGYDTCSPFDLGADVDDDTILITAPDRRASPCTGSTLALTADPVIAMRATLERDGRVTWAIRAGQLRIDRPGAPTLLLVPDRMTRRSSAAAPVDALTGTTWVPETLTVGGRVEPVVTNSGGSGALTFDGKGRFLWASCGGSAGAVTVTATTMGFTSGATLLSLCSDEAGPGQATPGQAAGILGSTGRPVRWTLVGRKLRLSGTDGMQLLLRPPRAGWPRWSATKVAQGDLGALPFRLGAFTFDHGPPGRSNVEIDLILQVMDGNGRLGGYGGTVFSDHVDAQYAGITMRILPSDASHDVAMGLTSSRVTRIVLIPKGRASLELQTHPAPGAEGVGWFIAEVPAGSFHVVGYDAAGRRVVSLDRTSEGLAAR